MNRDTRTRSVISRGIEMNNIDCGYILLRKAKKAKYQEEKD